MAANEWGWHVEAIDAPVAPHEAETTGERHAADLNDLGGNRPRLDAERLGLRRLHALERIADALEVLAGATMDAVEMMDPPRPDDEPDGALPGEEPVQ